jgi:hypothetical protein
MNMDKPLFQGVATVVLYAGPVERPYRRSKKTFHENVIGKGNYLAQFITQEQVDAIWAVKDDVFHRK